MDMKIANLHLCALECSVKHCPNCCPDEEEIETP